MGRAMVALSLAALILLATCAWTLTTLGMYQRADAAQASPSSEVQVSDETGFPEVDWDWWQEVNPDVVGWVTVPGTGIDHPIVAASADDPGRYLKTDVYGKRNAAGAVYLDAECDAGLFGSPNAVLNAHHISIGEDSMFADLAKYSDAEYASGRTTVLLQTPDAKRVYEIVAADVINGAEAAKVTDFANEAELSSWLESAVLASDVRLTSDTDSPGHCLTLATCSYNYWDDERTLVYAVQREEIAR